MVIAATVPSVVNGESSGAPPSAAGAVSGAVTWVVDRDGQVVQRVTAEIGPSRWLWSSTAALLLSEEVPMAGGYTEERRSLRPPWSAARHAVGVTAGPVVLGPASFHGLFRRVCDPTAGGPAWGAIEEVATVRLDRGIDRAGDDRSGTIALVTPPAEGAGRAADDVGIAFRPGVALQVRESGHLALAVVPVRLGPVTLAAVAGNAGFPADSVEGWLLDRPPVVLNRVVTWGGSVAVRTSGAEPAWLVADVLTRHAGYRPVRWGGLAAGGWDGRWVRLRLRGAVVQSGFRGLEGDRTARARLLAARAGAPAAATPVGWRAEWLREQRWDLESPAPVQDRFDARVTLRPERVPAFRGRVSGSVRSGNGGFAGPPPSRWRREIAGELQWTARVRRRSGAAARITTTIEGARWADPSDGGSPAVSEIRLSVAGGVPVGSKRRSLSGSLAAGTIWDGDSPPAGDLTVRGSAPLGERGRLSLSGDLPVRRWAPVSIARETLAVSLRLSLAW